MSGMCQLLQTFLAGLSSPAVEGAPARTNRLRLSELFEHDPKVPVVRGELLRQLGRLDEVVTVLRALNPDGYSEVKVVKVDRLASAGIAELRLLSFD